ncbi:sensor/bat box HTH-10 family transcription regulator [Natronomonas moolapensis 8.8.11]|uniref:Sensor/bat box HTH-10 family transcription regulator n=1 Tax=Natronomonas moolapensis (strain DSM 18674 / CECT 7526 / JCM 14361 / 8.8.11) TaxID=268739 RepID=M1XSC0_NATM8|nr:bacterio-opsin activator domain-containing protein [Natronomonas moolapensis]CCQ37261.1 sensor/bat box HTH-10 family transcription regulator [Natronomonas moolapensis 8.8.11]
MDERLTRAPMGVIQVAADGEITSANPAAADLLDTDPDALSGRDATEALPRSAAGTLQEALAADSPVEQSLEEYYPTVDSWLATEVAVVEGNTVLYVRDATARRSDRQTIDRLRRRLSRLESIDTLVTTVLRQIIDASAREEVWETVCRRLGTTDLYEFVWVGERDLTDDRLRVVASAGDAPDVLEAIEAELSANTALPEQRAVEAHSTCLVETIPEDEGLPRALRIAAFSRGLQSALAVPLSSEDTVYGVVGVYAARKEGFSAQERATLNTLGAVAGFAVNAIKQSDLLFADTVTEVSLEVRDGDLPLAEASATVDQPVSLAGAVARDDDVVVCYLRASGDTDRLMTILWDHSAVADARLVEDGEEASLLEVSLAGATPITTLIGWGATVTDATYDGDVVELVAELPPKSDVRAAVEAVDERFEDATLRARSERPREPETMEAFQRRLEESLTDKQRRVLRIAHLSDYFESPRGSTSEEVAEALDISGPTVLYHLRNAQRELLDAFFDTESQSDSDR